MPQKAFYVSMLTLDYDSTQDDDRASWKLNNIQGGNETKDDGNLYPCTLDSSPNSLSIGKQQELGAGQFAKKKRSLWAEMDLQAKIQKPDGSIQKHKARLVARGYMQREGIDFEETFSLIARFDTIHTVLSIVANYKWEVYQFDVKSAFLNEFLEQEVYVQQPKGYELKGEEMKVYKLRKALYGLKQAPRAWYESTGSHFNKNGFRKSTSEATLYVKTKGADEIMVSEFEMTDLGEMSYFLGSEVHQSEDGIFISQH
ncbi:UNVERIFIED_CONTAM: Retrovirus-related Pol polyprotein from transposon RE1 [Sesamum calycinum]|uniref:Retrovirus-related Pol polyprotein from transposon RE1 n=1 Tax=Sesamum calycinum TaxID=2727403 RepID=A0AAW2JEH3_9LAMI